MMIVVTGATGNVGGTLARLLAEAGEEVTAVSRRLPEGDLPDGVRHRAADLGDPASLESALDGADALFLLTAGDSPGEVLGAAKRHGVRRVVHLSSQGAGTRPEQYRHPRAFEEAVRESGLDWTILRPGGFQSNALMWAGSIREQRLAGAPFGDVGLPFVDPADIAEVAAAVLLAGGRSGSRSGSPSESRSGSHGGGLGENPGESRGESLDGSHAGRTYELTGPAPISPRERARAIGEALGEPVRFVEQSPEEARAQMLTFMPEPVVTGTLSILGEPTAAELLVSPDIEHILGRTPGTFADWAARNIAAFK
jgi:uncharacterized protein YbjT (DUF2867 family)